MQEEKFTVLVDNSIEGDDMPIESALILIKGFFDKYYNDTNMEIVIRRRSSPRVTSNS